MCHTHNLYFYSLCLYPSLIYFIESNIFLNNEDIPNWFTMVFTTFLGSNFTRSNGKSSFYRSLTQRNILICSLFFRPFIFLTLFLSKSYWSLRVIRYFLKRTIRHYSSAKKMHPSQRKFRNLLIHFVGILKILIYSLDLFYSNKI